jgi:hypothetical protein
MTTLANSPDTPRTPSCVASCKPNRSDVVRDSRTSRASRAPHSPPTSRPPDDPWTVALRLIESGATRNRAAVESGMNHATVYNRLRRIQEAHGLPPMPDARKRPRKRLAS